MSFQVEVPEKGVVHIVGFVTSSEMKKRITDIAKGVPGVTQVKGELGVLPVGGA